jgi:hypothetical protein
MPWPRRAPSMPIIACFTEISDNAITVGRLLRRRYAPSPTPQQEARGILLPSACVVCLSRGKGFVTRSRLARTWRVLSVVMSRQRRRLKRSGTFYRRIEWRKREREFLLDRYAPGSVNLNDNDFNMKQILRNLSGNGNLQRLQPTMSHQEQGGH